ncbi:hypothetical protein R3P38DRAFT_3376668 [Favolaschia claudopus]|uniref:F-box domain-containing protein n=1 Tax=Favolaschia claudopus TaxID=2862362 RepID=A0AAV9ZFE7_9AGAR
MSLAFPAEMWLHIFSFVSDRRSLRAIILSSRQFHDLALPELLRTVCWNSVDKAEAHLDFFETQINRRTIPTKLALTLPSDTFARIESVTAIVERIPWFTSLKSLSFANVHLSASLYAVLAQIPTLMYLSLDSCHLAVLPALYQQNPSPPVNLNIPITHLTVGGVSPLDAIQIHTLYRQLLSLLQNLVSLTLKDHFYVFLGSLPSLTSLAICARFDEHAVSLLKMHYLPIIAANVLHLRVDVFGAPPDLSMPVEPAEIVDISAPVLKSFMGSLYIANCLLRTSHNLSSITITTLVKKTQDALGFIEAASTSPIEDIELRVEDWDDEVLLAITHRLPSCRQVKLFFRYSQPSDDFLFNFGIQHLPSLTNLHTLHVHAVRIPPPLPAQSFGRRRPTATHTQTQTEEMAPPRIRAVDPAEEKCEEYLAVWKQYNPALRSVKFVEGREWRREGERGRWFAWGLKDVGGRDGEGVEEEIDDEVAEWVEDEDRSLGWEFELDGPVEMDSEEDASPSNLLSSQLNGQIPPRISLSVSSYAPPPFLSNTISINIPLTGVPAVLQVSRYWAADQDTNTRYSIFNT